MTASRIPRTAALGAGIVLALSLSLAACAAPAVGPTDTTESSAPAPSTDTAAPALPDGFPTDDVPLIDGEILEANHPGNIWAVWIASDDLVADMAAATQLLVDAGYENVIATPGYSDFHGTKYQVHVTAADDPKYGPSIAYSFYEVQ